MNKSIKNNIYVTLSRGTAEGSSRANLLRLCSFKNNPARPQLCITLYQHVFKMPNFKMT